MVSVMNAAFIGCGAIAQKKHLPLAKKNPNIHIKIMYDKDERTKQQCLQTFGNEDTVLAKTPDEIFRRNDVDVVFIASPNNTHAEYAVRALERKMNVICEKPMAVSAEEARMMLEASERNDRLLHISYQNRYTSQAIYVKQLYEDGFFGDVYYAKAYAVRRRAVPTWGTLGKREIQGGGALIDIGSHAIDLALWLSDSFEPLYAVGTTYDKFAKRGSGANLWGTLKPRQVDVEDCAIGFVVMKNGMTLFVEASYALNTVQEMEASADLFGILGGASLRESDEVILIHEMGGKMCITKNRLQESRRSLTPDNRVQSASEREHAEVTKLLLNGEKDKSAVQAFVTAQIVEGIYESAKSGRPVYF